MTILPTTERAMTRDDAIAAILGAALEVAELSARFDREAFGALVAPGGPAATRAYFCTPNVRGSANSTCGVAALGILHRAGRTLGVDVCGEPITDSTWWARLVALATKHGAYRTKGTPGLGCIVYVSVPTPPNGDTNRHWFIPVSGSPGAGRFDSVDGGQVDQGYQCMRRVTREIRDGVEVPVGRQAIPVPPRPVGAWIDAPALLVALVNAQGAKPPAAPVAPPPKPAAPRPEGAPLRVIDVSSNNGRIDWTRAATDCDAAYLRAQIGAGTVVGRDVDGELERNAAGCRAKELPFGVYGVLYPRHGRAQDADVQARQLAAWHRKTGATLAPMIDIEDLGHVDDAVTAAEWRAALILYVGTLLEEGLTPIIYTGPAWWGQHEELEQIPWLGCLLLWLASYTDQAPAVPEPWAGETGVALWQYQGGGPTLPERFRGRCAGVPTDCDRNHLYMPLERLAA